MSKTKVIHKFFDSRNFVSPPPLTRRQVSAYMYDLVPNYHVVPFSCQYIGIIILCECVWRSCVHVFEIMDGCFYRLNLTTECNVNCVCSSDGFDPVCGSDGFLYFSPCHAGCTRMVNSTGQPNDHEGPLVSHVLIDGTVG